MLRSIPVSVPGRIYISRQNDAKSSGRIEYVFLLFIRTPLAAAGGVLVEGVSTFFRFYISGCFSFFFFLFGVKYTFRRLGWYWVPIVKKKD